MTHNLLIISDLHIGAPGLTDLDDEDAAWTDESLVSFLEDRQDTWVDGLPWRLVINGDMLEFLRAAPPTDRELPEDHSEDARLLDLLERMLESHGGFFTALARFVSRGHELVVVRGNHDPELFLPALSARFLDHLAALAAGDEERDSFLARVRMEPDAYYEEGRIHIEHGHLADHFTAWGTEAEARSSGAAMTLGARLIRDIGNWFQGVNMFRMEQWSGLKIVRWFFRVAPVRLILFFPILYVMVVGRLLRDWARQGPARPRAWAEPARPQLVHIAGIAQLDRLVVYCLALTVGLLFLDTLWLAALAAGTVIVLGELIASQAVVRYDIHAVARHLRTVAQRTARARKVPLVVFGHTHFPERIRFKGGTYVNGGNWLGDAQKDEDLHDVFNVFTFVTVLRNAPPADCKLQLWCGSHGAIDFADRHAHRASCLGPQPLPSATAVAA